MAVKPTASTSSVTGLLFGVTSESKLSNSTYLSSEVLYTQMGYSQLMSGVEAVFEYNALKIPVLLKKKTYPGPDGVRFGVFAGPSVAFRLSTQLKYGTQTVNAETHTQSTLFSLEAGALLEQSLRDGLALYGAARYVYGLTNLEKPETTGSSTMNRDIQITAGLCWAF